MNNIKQLNAFDSKCERGWFLGHFAKIPELKNEDVEAQIVEHETGKEKNRPAFNKRGKTLTMVLSGKMDILFPEEKKTINLNKEGDFVIFSEKIIHSWKCTEKAKVLTIRWPSLPNDVVEV